MIRIGFYCFQACFKIPLLQFAFSDPLSKNLKTLSIVKRQYRIYKHLTQQNLLYCILYCIVIDISHGYSCDCYPIAIWLYVAEEILSTATQLGLCWEMWMWKMYRSKDKSNVNAITLLCFQFSITQSEVNTRQHGKYISTIKCCSMRWGKYLK